MMRDGYHEPERVFPPPPARVLEGNLDERAFEMLELVVWVFRISQHGERLRQGVDWAVLQRWYDVGSSQEMKHRIHAALAFLVADGFLREGPRTSIPVNPGLTSDHFVPTEKAFRLVDQRQAPLLKKGWFFAADRAGVIAAIVAVVSGVAVLLRFFGLI